MITLPEKTRLALILAATIGLTACGGSSSSSTSAADNQIPDQVTPPSGNDDSSDNVDEPAPAAERYEPLVVGVLPDTQGGSDAQGQDHVATITMEKVLDHQLAAGVDIVIPVGDLTDAGSEVEWAEWTSLAQQYRD